jgi:hypothetical protein
MNPGAFDKLCDDLAVLDGGDAERLRAAIHAIENEADSANARAFLAAIGWVAAQDERSVAERLAVMAELMALPRGHVFIPSMAEFCGWGRLSAPRAAGRIRKAGA